MLICGGLARGNPRWLLAEADYHGRLCGVDDIFKERPFLDRFPEPLGECL